MKVNRDLSEQNLPDQKQKALRFVRSRTMFFVMVVFALLLSLATYILFEEVDRFHVAGEELITNPGFENGSEGWDADDPALLAEIVGGRVVFENPEPDAKVLRQYFMRPETDFLLVTVVGQLSDVRIGAEFWQMARADLMARTSGDEFRFRQTVFAEVGSESLRAFEAVISLPVWADELKVEFELTGATGHMEVHSVSALPVAPAPRVGRLIDIAFGVWIMFSAGTAFLLAASMGLKRALAPIAASAGLLLVPDSMRLVVVSMLTPVGAAFSPDHFVFFTVLSLYFLYLSPRKQWAAAFCRIIGLVALAICLELVQYYVPGRTPDLVDLWSNLLGIGIGSMLAAALKAHAGQLMPDNER